MLPRVAYDALWDFVPYAEVAKMPLDLLAVKGVVAPCPIGNGEREGDSKEQGTMSSVRCSVRQLMTFSPMVTVLNVSSIPYITWPPCLWRFSEPHLTSFSCSMNGDFCAKLVTSPVDCVLVV